LGGEEEKGRPRHGSAGTAASSLNSRVGTIRALAGCLGEQSCSPTRRFETLKILMATTGVAMILVAGNAQAQTTLQPPAATMQRSGQADVQKLIGRSVTNPQNETVGDIESVIVDTDGKVRTVIVGVGGFLGMGERHVAIAWDSLTVSPTDQKVVISSTKDQLKALPPYTYADAAAQRRSVFVDRLPPAAGSSTLNSAPTTMPTAAYGMVSVSDLMGLNIRNAANETIGEIKDVVLTSEGKIHEVIVGVGGFLGMGERYVALKWDQLRVGRSSDNSVIGQVSTTTEHLKGMPAYKREKSLWIRS